MRKLSGKKKGALSPLQCVDKATAILSESSMCLFLIDGIDFTGANNNQIALLHDFTEEANDYFANEFPKNQLAVINRNEKGFQFFIGDASWAGISDPETITRIIAFKDAKYPELSLHYGVTADAWSDGIELAK